MKEVWKEMNEEQLMFAKSAWMLFNHRDEILANPRMAHAPIDMQNVLSYASPLAAATVGVYLEWWMKCAGTLHTNERGVPTLMVRFCGSPLSGVNTCTMVAWDGAIEQWQSDQFHYVWHHFLDINKQYRLAKSDVKPYSLEEVINMIAPERRESVGADKDF